MSGSPPIAGASGVADWPGAVEMLSSHLHGMATMYPQSRDLIVHVQKSLRAAFPGDWAGSFKVLDLPYDVTIRLGIERESAMEILDVFRQPDAAPPSVEPAPVPKPRLRTGNDERRRYQEHLTTMYAEGYLDREEWEKRVTTLQAVLYEDELRAVVRELPPLPPQEPEVSGDLVPGMRDPGKLERGRLLRARSGVSLIGMGAAAILTELGMVVPGGSGYPLRVVVLMLLMVSLVVGLMALNRR